MTWTSIWVIYSLEAFTVQCLATFQHRVQEILSSQHFFKDQQFYQRPAVLSLTFDLKINREHLLSMNIHCTSFGNFQAKGSKDIEQTSLGLHTNRKEQNNMSPFFKGRCIHITSIISADRKKYVNKIFSDICLFI